MKCLEISIGRHRLGLMGESLVVLAKESLELTQSYMQGLFKQGVLRLREQNGPS